VAQLVEDILEGVHLAGHHAHDLPVGVLRLVDEQQLGKVHGHEVLGHGQDEELLPGLLEQQELIGHGQFGEGPHALDPVDVLEEMFGGGFLDVLRCHQRRSGGQSPGGQGIHVGSGGREEPVVTLMVGMMGNAGHG